MTVAAWLHYALSASLACDCAYARAAYKNAALYARQKWNVTTFRQCFSHHYFDARYFEMKLTVASNTRHESLGSQDDIYFFPLT